MEYPYLVDIRKTRFHDVFGHKGAGLNWLRRHRFPIPHTLVITFAGCKLIDAAGEQGLSEIIDLLSEHISPNTSYAVRSSASVEDGQDLSFAGQFRTVTNVRGTQEIREAIQTVLASKNSEALRLYRNKLDEQKGDLTMAVLVQEMVEPVMSGVAFSKNPTTGLDEVVIEAVRGLGETLVQGGATPERWIYRWKNFTAQPENGREYGALIQKVAEDTRRIANKYGSPVDLEWVYDGKNLYWLQVRPVTALDNIPLHSNRISREVLPGIIKPLIASINIPLVNSAWIKLFDSLLGRTGLQPQELTRLFHYRAYFNMAAIGKIFEILGFPRESLEMLLGLENTSGRPTFRPSFQTLRHIPRLLRFLVLAWNYDRTVIPELHAIEQRVREFQTEDLRAIGQKELLERIDKLYQFNLEVAYQNILIPILMSIFNAILRAQLRPLKVDFLDFNLTAGLEGLRAYEPNPYLDELKNMFELFPRATQARIRQSTYLQAEQIQGIDGFILGIKHFIQRFGHLSESGNDFSKTPWREDPDTVLRMVLDHIPGSRADQKVTWDTLPASTMTRFGMRPFYMRARRLRLQREQISSLYTTSYGWFRVYFKALSRLLREKNLINEENDIFYLTWQEIRALTTNPENSPAFERVISTRKDEIEASVELALPAIIFGDHAPPLSLMKNGMKKIAGIPTSPGYFQGPLRIVRSSNDFGKVKSGDALAIPYSDVAWTPLFSKAGAVIAESGGVLSHSSIVAREYGIPCVVSVNDACHLPDGAEVIVDGYQGSIQIVREP